MHVLLVAFITATLFGFHGTILDKLEQVALLWQRNRATRLSVEILQLQNNPIV